MRTNLVADSPDEPAAVIRARSYRTALGIIALGLSSALAIWWQTEGFRKTKSVTVDESFHLSVAEEIVSQTTLSPRLAMHGTAPLPTLLTWVPAAGMSAFTASRTDPPPVHHVPERSLRVVSRARTVHAMLIGVPLVFLVGLWLWYLRGFATAWLGAGMMSLSPTIIAHSAVATTDASLAFTSLATLASLSLLARKLQTGRFVASATLCGLAIAAKYSGVFLLLVAGIALLCAVARQQTNAGMSAIRVTRRVIMDVGLLWVGYVWIAGVVCWALHGLAVLPIHSAANFPSHNFDSWLADWGEVVVPAPLVGMVFQYLHNEAGHPAFLVGQTSQTGWWYYFPLALVCKSTPSELLLFGLLPIAAWHFSRATWKKVSQIQFRAEITAARGAANWPLDQLLLWTALLVYGFLMLNVRVQIGHRYLLPIYPMVCLLAIDWLGSWWQERRWRAIVTIGVLLSVQLFSVVGIAPHYLAYFSPFVGGSTRRHPTGSCK